MQHQKIERNITELRARPLALLSRIPEGKEHSMTVRECISSRSSYIRVIADDLDALLAGCLEKEIIATTKQRPYARINPLEPLQL